MGTLYIDTGGATTNSGSTDVNAADLSGTAATVAGSVVSLDGSPDLSGIITSGTNQSSIHLNDATNGNQKIFWITAADDGADTVTVSVAPTGVTSSAWAIGGRHVLTNASIESTVVAGDVVIFNNSPASNASSRVWTQRNDGNSTGGFITIKGAAGARPVFEQTGTSQVIWTLGKVMGWYENLEIIQSGASGTAIQLDGGAHVVYNVKVSDGAGIGISMDSASGHHVVACELTAITGVAISMAAGQNVAWGNYIHDCSSHGIEKANITASSLIANNVIDTCTGRGIYYSGATTSTAMFNACIGNTVYNCGASGIEVADADTRIFLVNNIFQDNGNAAGESNAEWVAGSAEIAGLHAWNLFYNNSGADAPINLTVNAHVASSELTTDPLFTDAAGGDFSLGASSPAKGTGFPGQLLGGSLGVLDMGAVQRAEAGGGGVVLSNMSGGMRG